MFGIIVSGLFFFAALGVSVFLGEVPSGDPIFRIVGSLLLVMFLVTAIMRAVGNERPAKVVVQYRKKY